MWRRARGVSSVVSVVLLVAVVVILAASVSVFTIDAGGDLQEAPPLVADSAAEYQTGGGNCSTDVVRLSHQGGDAVDLSETRTVVRLPDSGGKEATITGFPVSGSTLDSSDVEDPDNILDSSGCVGGAAANGDGEWTAGDSFSFKLNSGAGNVDPGDTVVVLVVHEPSESIVVEYEIEVE